MDDVEIDAALDEAHAEGFRDGVAAASCGCPHVDSCPRSENYRPGLLGRLRRVFGGGA